MFLSIQFSLDHFYCITTDIKLYLPVKQMCHCNLGENASIKPFLLIVFGMFYFNRELRFGPNTPKTLKLMLTRELI